MPKSQTAEKGAVNYKVIVGASTGNGTEIFDFTVYSFFAAIIGKLYFPSDSAYGSLLMSVAVFGVGFIMRPLGSMVLGAYADRVGRKAAMLMTIVLMGIGTALIAFAPTYAQIGVLAPVLIVVGRLIQGFAAGGEVGSATTLLLESAGANQRGFFVSWQAISQASAPCSAPLAGWHSPIFCRKRRCMPGLARAVHHRPADHSRRRLYP